MKKTTAIVDCRICEQSVNSLTARGFRVVKLPPFSRLSPDVASHPDMLTFILGGKLITHRDYYNENRDIFSSVADTSGLTVLTSDEDMAGEYPSDILFNAFVYDRHIFGLSASLSRYVRELESEGYTLHNVKQGYAACSCAFAGDGVITADRSLYRSLTDCGIRALLIESGGITLPFRDYGFIGGASGYADGVVYFNGDIDLHPSGKAIRDFAQKVGCECVCLCDGMLADIGKIIFV